MKIKLAEQEGKIFVSSQGEIHEVLEEDYNKITSGLYHVTKQGDNFLFEENQEAIEGRKQLEAMQLQSQMRKLNADRRDLQDLVDFGFATQEDEERLASITLKLGELAEERKNLIIG